MANRLKASAKIQHGGPRDHEQHLVEEGDECGGDRRPMARKQRQPAKIDGNDGQRTEQRAGIAPGKRIVAEKPDRERDELLRKRRMHRVEHRFARRRFEHLPRRRHVMRLVEHEFFRRGDADE